MDVKMIMTGPDTGKTRVIQGKQFVKGVYVISASNPQSLEHQMRFVERTCQAFQEGSEQLRIAQERDQGREYHPSTTSQRGNPKAVRGSVGGPAGQVSSVLPNAGPGLDPAQPADGASGMVSSGSGLPDAGLPPGKVAEIRKALNALDPTADASWTVEGLPSVEAVSDMLADPAITRAMLLVVEPELTREAALAKLDAEAI